MSQENLEIVIRVTRAATARPEPDYSTLGELVAPDHVFVPIGVASGIEQEAIGLEGFWSWRQATEDFMPVELDLKGAVDIGRDKVLTVTDVRFKGKTSGVGSGQRLWAIVTVRGGQVVRTEGFTDPQRALEAAGLSE